MASRLGRAILLIILGTSKYHSILPAILFFNGPFFLKGGAVSLSACKREC